MSECKKCGKHLKRGSKLTAVLVVSGYVAKDYPLIDQFYDALDADQFDVEIYCTKCK